ncbi:MAG: hypothetical protein GY727_15300 [Gammaproteobacteria bacterium]|nr:hypothetical protein [Gammaproteobacteria bacterium]MCP4091400.1 hypothetical protein [Gammaproteobacteria bacterium]MCP4275642.1 hypothetical protein [Gammaproteobacteria bacterium]MCP4831440.1 hypothetical protein [Gammaproteobacteria bacterium]MCP4930214.1 hypothetical protein [Gammaproteobacteria bacterium]
MLFMAMPLQAAGTLKRIQENSKIRIGYSTYVMPFSSRIGAESDFQFDWR